MEIVLPIPHPRLYKTLMVMNHAGHLKKKKYSLNVQEIKKL